MGVPDELRALDDDLAAGRVDASTYRRRRDDLIASREPPVTTLQGPGRQLDRERERQLDLELDRELDLDAAPLEEQPASPVAAGPPPLASGPPPLVPGPPPLVPGPRPLGSATAPPLPGPRAPTSGLRPPPGGSGPCPPPGGGLRPPPGGEESTAGRPVAPDPFPPPFRWAAPTGPDVTQVVPTGSAEATQVVPTGLVEATQVVRGVGGPHEGVTATAERTRVVPGSVVARSAARSAALPAASMPPWVAGPTGGAAHASAQLRRRQGAEVFVRQGPRPAVLVSTTLVVLVAVFVVVGSLLLS